MRIELRNREWPFLRLFDCFRLPTITVIVRNMISEIERRTLNRVVDFEYFKYLNI